MSPLRLVRLYRTLLSLMLLLPFVTRAQERIVVAYVTSGAEDLPDMSLMTHINYAFGHVNKTFNGVRIQRPERLREITAAKGDVKVCLSVGGWGSGRFSEMAADEACRKSFVDSCLAIVEEFGLDGIDIDWEYPTSSAAGISSSPEDTDNFTLLMRDLRATLGKDRILTLATAASARYIDFPAILPYVDFVNVMSYDMGRPPRHNAPLYPSRGISGRMTSDGAIKVHLAAGVPADKLVMGMPFYGHGKEGYNDYVDYKDLMLPLEGHHEVWDEDARVPYYANAEGRLVLGFDNVRSIGEKCNYIVENGLLGAMYWEYNCDNATKDLARTVAEKILK